MTTTTGVAHRSTAVLTLAISTGAVAFLMFGWIIISVAAIESTTDTAAIRIYVWISGAAAVVTLVLVVVWAARRRNSAEVLCEAVAVGILAGLLLVLYQAIDSDFYVGFTPLAVNAALVVVLTAIFALLSIGMALIALVTLTRFLSNPSLIVIACATVATLIGVGAGVLFARESTLWISVLGWGLPPTAYVAVTFPWLNLSRSRESGSL